MSERRASDCLIMLSTKHGNRWYHINAIVMARPGFEPPDLPLPKRTLGSDNSAKKKMNETLKKSYHVKLYKVIVVLNYLK